LNGSPLPFAAARYAVVVRVAPRRVVAERRENNRRRQGALGIERAVHHQILVAVNELNDRTWSNDERGLSRDVNVASDHLNDTCRPFGSIRNITGPGRKEAPVFQKLEPQSAVVSRGALTSARSFRPRME